MARLGKYDPDLSMFVEEPRDVDLRRLWFLRHLIEHGDTSDGTILSQPSGDLSMITSIDPHLPSSEDLYAA